MSLMALIEKLIQEKYSTFMALENFFLLKVPITNV
jgi:hypothetical protein